MVFYCTTTHHAILLLENQFIRHRYHRHHRRPLCEETLLSLQNRAQASRTCRNDERHSVHGGP